VVFAVGAKMAAYAPKGNGHRGLASTKICSAKSATPAGHVATAKKIQVPSVSYAVTDVKLPILWSVLSFTSLRKSAPLFDGGLAVAFAIRPPPITR